jgi:hypothetical protein
LPARIFHSLVCDSVYYEDSNKRICFWKLPPPTDSEVAPVTASIAKKIQRLLERCGLGPQACFEEADPLFRDQPLLGGVIQHRCKDGLPPAQD